MQSPSAGRLAPLLQPMMLRGMPPANRLVMAPMSRYRSPAGIPGADVAGYYRRRAEQGVGLIITEGVGIAHPVSVDHPAVPRLHGTASLAGWRVVVDAVHAAGGRILPQLWHQGVMWNVEYAGDAVAPGHAMRPSGLWGPADGVISLRPEAREASLAVTRAMTESDIQDVIDAYALSSRNAAEIGFDGIAIHGAHGYLIDSFLWQATNRRQDRWGGDARGRAEFGAEVVRAVRRAIGPELPIVLRVSQFKMQDYRARLAETPDELAALLAPLAEAGVDLFDGSQRFFDTPVFTGSELNLAGWMKRLTGVASMTVGGIGLDKSSAPARHIDGSQTAADNLDRVLERFARGEFDLVGVGRSLLNDPAWFAKACAGEAFLPFDPANLERLT